MAKEFSQSDPSQSEKVEKQPRRRRGRISRKAGAVALAAVTTVAAAASATAYGISGGEGKAAKTKVAATASPSKKEMSFDVMKDKLDYKLKEAYMPGWITTARVAGEDPRDASHKLLRVSIKGGEPNGAVDATAAPTFKYGFPDQDPAAPAPRQRVTYYDGVEEHEPPALNPVEHSPKFGQSQVEVPVDPQEIQGHGGREEIDIFLGANSGDTLAVQGEQEVRSFYLGSIEVETTDGNSIAIRRIGHNPHIPNSFSEMNSYGAE